MDLVSKSLALACQSRLIAAKEVKRDDRKIFRHSVFLIEKYIIGMVVYETPRVREPISKVLIRFLRLQKGCNMTTRGSFDYCTMRCRLHTAIIISWRVVMTMGQGIGHPRTLG